jgi:hypothetical protein
MDEDKNMKDDTKQDQDIGVEEIKVSSVFTPISIDGHEFRLRYPGLVQISIEKTAAKELFGQTNMRYTAKGLLQYLDQAEIQSYLLWKGIMGCMPEYRKMKFDEAVELRDRFLSAGEMDSGEKLEDLITTLAMAVSSADGADGKKLKDKIQKQREDEELKRLTIIEKAKLRAMEERGTERAGTGMQQPDSA